MPDTKTERQKVQLHTRRDIENKRICVKTMTVKRLGRKTPGPQGSGHLLSVSLINSKTVNKL